MKKLHLTLLTLAAIAICGCRSEQARSANLPDPSSAQVAKEEVAAPAPAVIVYTGEPELRGIKPEKPVVIDFNATWCGPCRMFAPIFHDVAEQLKDDYTFYSIDVDRYQRIARYYGASAIPFVVVIGTDGTVTTSVGAMEAPDLINFITTAPK